MLRAIGDFFSAAVVFCWLLGIKLQGVLGEILLCTKSDFNFFGFVCWFVFFERERERALCPGIENSF